MRKSSYGDLITSLFSKKFEKWSDCVWQVSLQYGFDTILSELERKNMWTSRSLRFQTKTKSSSKLLRITRVQKNERLRASVGKTKFTMLWRICRIILICIHVVSFAEIIFKHFRSPANDWRSSICLHFSLEERTILTESNYCYCVFVLQIPKRIACQTWDDLEHVIANHDFTKIDSIVLIR